MKNLHLLEQWAYVEPGPITKKHLDETSSATNKRWANLSDFKKTADSKCGWCNEIDVPGKLRKYCSDDCRNSASLYCFPQTPKTKAWVFINKQDCVCLGCGECFDEEVDKKIMDKWMHYTKNMPDEWKVKTKVTYHSVGYDTGYLWNVDHVVPLHLGGSGIGLENIQVICVPCHEKKTAGENSSRLKRLYRSGKNSL